jgi:hypothetical protein
MIRVATRRSPLALLQAEEVAAQLRGLGAEVTVVPMRTEGDRRAAAQLAEIGGKGLFVRELDQALLAGDADVAVHSLKDVPAELPDGLVLAVYPERQAPHDVLVTRRDATLDTLPEGAVVGTPVRAAAPCCWPRVPTSSSSPCAAASKRGCTSWSPHAWTRWSSPRRDSGVWASSRRRPSRCPSRRSCLQWGRAFLPSRRAGTMTGL